MQWWRSKYPPLFFLENFVDKNLLFRYNKDNILSA